MPRVRDRDRLRAAFEALRTDGYWARGAQPDGIAAVPEDVIKRGGSFVLWHQKQDSTAFDDFGDVLRPLYLHHRYCDAPAIAARLRTEGLRVRIDGRAGQEVVVVEPHAYDAAFQGEA